MRRFGESIGDEWQRYQGYQKDTLRNDTTLSAFFVASASLRVVLIS
jgi:hypothetical protein